MIFSNSLNPKMECLVKLCVNENILVIPILDPSAFVVALSALGLATEEFMFVGFLSKHVRLRRERLVVSANESATQIFFVLLHKLNQFIKEASSIFGDCRQSKDVFSTHPPKGEIRFLIKEKANCEVEISYESELENELREFMDKGHSLSRLVVEGTSVRKKAIYSLALRKFGKQIDDDN
ncbi:16S rRNA (cytidine(1402)-2'-O)-methyltransferase [Bertholletia excelsa]